MILEPYKPASVQYNDWKGSIAGDEVDLRPMELFLGIDREIWRLLHIEIGVFGGTQSVEPYVIPAEMTYADLESQVSRGRPIELTRLQTIEFEPSEVWDTNPPRPLAMPVISAMELLGFGFKRLVIKLTSRNIPQGATFEFVDLAEDQDS